MGGGGEQAVEQRGDTDLRRIVQRRAILGKERGAEGRLGGLMGERVLGGGKETGSRVIHRKRQHTPLYHRALHPYVSDMHYTWSQVLFAIKSFMYRSLSLFSSHLVVSGGEVGLVG